MVTIMTDGSTRPTASLTTVQKKNFKLYRGEGISSEARDVQPSLLLRRISRRSFRLWRILSLRFRGPRPKAGVKSNHNSLLFAIPDRRLGQNHQSFLSTPAFILLEIIIGIAIASMIGVALMNTFFQSNSMVQALDDIFLRDRRTSIMNHVIEKDVSGIFIPAYVPVKEKKAQVKPPKLNKLQTEAEIKAEAEKKKTAEEKKLEKVFYAVHGGASDLKTLSFITTSIVGGYGLARPRIGRVVYRLEEVKGEKDAKKAAYTLFRQESENLDYQAFKPDAASPIRSFAIVDNIKKMSCEYGVYEKKEGKKELKILKEWMADDKKKSTAGKDKEKQPFPNVLMMHVTLWDAKKERDFTLDITIPILADHTLTSTKGGGDTSAAAKDADQESAKKAGRAQGATGTQGTMNIGQKVAGQMINNRAAGQKSQVPAGQMPMMQIPPQNLPIQNDPQLPPVEMQQEEGV